MNTIPSPYNFVPLASQIFYPPWGAQVSMEVPFSDGICGWLAIRLTAETPIFTGNGGEANKEFFQVVDASGDYAINGTTFKGMLRNIIEIAAFGKLRQEEERVYSFRDLYYRKYTNRLTRQQGSAYEPKVKAGWLQEGSSGEWQLTPCEFARVELSALMAYHPQAPALGDKQEVGDKFAKWGDFSRTVSFDSSERPTVNPHHCDSCRRHQQRRLHCELVYRKATNLGQGRRQGEIVFTGQPAQWRPRDRHKKHMEFIFYDAAATAMPVPAAVKKNFLAVHCDQNGKPLAAWQHYKSEFAKGQKIPVFYLADESGKGIEHLGLSLMFRLPYRQSIHDCIRNSNPAHCQALPLDLAEVMFGRAGDDDHNLQGRINIEPLLAEGKATPLPEMVQTVLGQPRPTYYPNYIEQQTDTTGKVTGQDYQTYEDKEAKIRGWKRYPVRPAGQPPKPADPPRRKKDGTINREATVCFTPLEAGATFTGRLHVHNLRPIELGALFWALSWGGDPSKRHNIGMAKPYGYGTIRLEVIPEGCQLHDMQYKPLTQEDLAQYRQRFCQTMAAAVPNWQHSPQIRELLAMADPSCQWPKELRRYPDLADQEFAKSKQERRSLRPHSEGGQK